MNDAIFKLEDLTVKADGLASMAMALREAFFVGESAPETYFDAVHHYATLMCEFRGELNEAVNDLRKESKKC